MHQKDIQCEKVIIKANLTEMLVQYMDNKQPEYLHSLNEALFYKLNLANSNHIGDLNTLYSAHFYQEEASLFRDVSSLFGYC